MFAHVFLALVSIGQVVNAPVWQADYSAARSQAIAQKKPLAVVLGTGANGMDKVVVGLDKETQKRLANDFVCVYVDTSSPNGKLLATAFEIVGGQGVVLSDRSAKSQAFWKQGTITGQEFAQQVQSVTTTSRTSFYPADASAATILTGGTLGTTFQEGSSYCPNCQNGGGRFRR